MDFEIHLEKILVPTDFSDHSDHSFRHAAAIARWSRAEMIILHVVEKFADHSLLYSDVWPFHRPRRDYYADLEEKTKKRLMAQVRESLGDIVHCRIEVTTGIPSVEITATAAREAVDMIVIATHGRGGIAKALLGSTTERVLRKAECPVLVMRSGMEGFVRPPPPAEAD